MACELGVGRAACLRCGEVQRSVNELTSSAEAGCTEYPITSPAVPCQDPYLDILSAGLEPSAPVWAMRPVPELMSA